MFLALPWARDIRGHLFRYEWCFKDCDKQKNNLEQEVSIEKKYIFLCFCLQVFLMRSDAVNKNPKGEISKILLNHNDDSNREETVRRFSGAVYLS